MRTVGMERGHWFCMKHLRSERIASDYWAEVDEGLIYSGQVLCRQAPNVFKTVFIHLV